MTIVRWVHNAGMHLGLHLPQLDLDGRGLSRDRLVRAAHAAREAGFGSVCANDHVVFHRPWLDCLLALTSVVEASGDLGLMTTVAVPALRHPAVLARSLADLDLLSGGRVVAGIGAGSSRADYEAVGLPFEERWRRLDDAAEQLRATLRGVPLWVASWGSPAGLRRVARYGDGWLASAYNTDPPTYAAAREQLPDGLPTAVVTMWTWVTEDDAEAERVLAERLAPVVNRDPEHLRERVCIGSAQRCGELLAAYAEAGCERVHVWPVGDEERQVELIAALAPGTTP